MSLGLSSNSTSLEKLYQLNCLNDVRSVTGIVEPNYNTATELVRAHEFRPSDTSSTAFGMAPPTGPPSMPC